MNEKCFHATINDGSGNIQANEVESFVYICLRKCGLFVLFVSVRDVGNVYRHA